MIHRMTGRFVSHHSLQSSTGWYDINDGRLWSGMLSAAGLDTSLFPEVLPCGVKAGTLTKQAACDLGLAEDITVATGAMDQICSAIGAGNIVPGIITETTGTALVIGATSVAPDYTHPLKPVYYTHYEKGRFLLLPYCTTAGIVLKWFKDEFCGEELAESARTGRQVYDILDRLAETVAPGSDGLIVLPHFAGSYSPDLNPSARGVFFGVDLAKKRGHFVRAILESIAYMLRENTELLEKTGAGAREIRSLGGGAKSALWNRIKADVTGRTVVTMVNGESTSLGAAILGSVALGWHRSVAEACESTVVTAKRFEPDEAARGIYDRQYARYLSLYRALAGFFRSAQP